MKLKKLSKKDVLTISLFLVVFLLTIPFAKESIGRILIIEISILIYLTIFLFYRNMFLSFVFLLFLVLPFNITYQIPIPVEQSMSNGLIVNYLIPTISILDLVVGIFLALVFLQEGFTFFKKVFYKYKLGLIVFFVFLLIQNIFLQNPLSILNSVRLFSYLLAFILILEKIPIKKKTISPTLFSAPLLVSVLVQGIIGLKQFLRGVSLGWDFLGESQVSTTMLGSSFISLNSGSFLRAYGTFPHPNVLGGFFLLTFFASLFLFKTSKGKQKIIPIITMILSVCFSFLTFSRSVILLFLLVLFVLLIKKIFVKKKINGFLPMILFERFFQGFKEIDSSLVDRRNLIKSGYLVFKENFLLGTGLGNFVREMGVNAPKTVKGMSLMQPVHNVFLLLLCELGVFGFLSFLFLIFDILRKNIKRVTLFGILICLVIITISLVDHYFVSLPQGLMMLLIMLSLIIFESKTNRLLR